MCGPSVHLTEGRQSNKPGQRRRQSRPDAPLIHQAPEADRGRDSGRRSAVQGRDTSVGDTTSKGCFVQGVQHPRTFGRGHISRGHINPAFWALRSRSSSRYTQIQKFSSISSKVLPETRKGHISRPMGRLQSIILFIRKNASHKTNIINLFWIICWGVCFKCFTV